MRSVGSAGKILSLLITGARPGRLVGAWLALWLVATAGPLPARAVDLPPSDSLACPPDTGLGAQPYRQRFPPQPQFEQLSTAQGLSSPNVYAMLQDAQGFMWFGTDDGLNRYDGHTTAVFKHDPDDPGSLSNNAILDLYEDGSGALWVATFGGGLSRLDRGQATFTHFRHDASDPTSISSDYVVRIYEDRQGAFWITTEGGGLNRLNPATGRFTHYRHDPDDPTSISHDIVTRVLEDSRGTLWVGTDGGGLNRFDRDSATFVRYGHDDAAPGSISSDVIWSILEDRDGTLWVGTFGGGVNRYRPAQDDFVPYRHDESDPGSISSDNVRLLFEDSLGTLWVGTLDAGLNRFDRDRQRFLQMRADPADGRSLQSDVVWSLVEDRSGVLWVGTLGAGAQKYPLRQERLRHVPAAPDSPASPGGEGISGLLEDDRGLLWLATSHGLDRYDPRTGRFLHYRHDPENPASISLDVTGPMAMDQDGVLWVGTFGGGISGLDTTQPEAWDPVTARFVRHRQAAEPGELHDVIWSLYVDRAGTLWVGTQTGLDARPPGTDRVVHYRHDPDDGRTISNDVIRDVLEDSQGRLWVATDEGLNQFVPAEGRFVRYLHDPDDDNSLSHNVVFTLNEDRRGILWLGTWGGGLNRFDPETERFTHYTTQDGLPHDTVNAIVEDGDGYLWLSTNGGLARFAPDTESVTIFDHHDGLHGSVIGALLISCTGEMLVADGTGFTILVPQELSETAPAPPVVLTRLTQAGETLADGKSGALPAPLTLRWPHNYFEFEYAALDYVQPEANQYAYMLEGFDVGWISMGSRWFSRYTNLPGGQYTLRVKGSNSDGVWNEAGAALAVTVVPPVWATWWFRLLLVVGVLGSAWAFYGLRLRRLSQQQAWLVAEEQRRQEQFRVINQVGRRVTAIMNIDELLSELVRLIQGAFGYYHVAIGMVDGDEVIYRTGAGALWDNPAFGFSPARLKVGAEGLSGWVAAHGQPVSVPDVSQDPRYVWMQGSRTRSELIVPIEIQGEVVGVLDAQSDRLHAFDDTDLMVLQSLAHQAGTAIENARLYAQARELAVVEERGRLARDLHDAVTQSVYSLTLMAEAGRRMMAGHDLPEIEANQQRIRDIAQQALQEMRLLVYQLRPSVLKELGLTGALEQRLEAVERRAGIEARLQSSGNDPLAPGLEEQLYRIAQEALNNALKHAQATAVTVTLQLAPTQVTLTVTDDGRGFEPLLAEGQGGQGLSNMRARAAEIGGRLTVRAAPGAGATLRVTAPNQRRGTSQATPGAAPPKEKERS